MDNISIDLLRKNMDTIILKSLYDNSKYGLEIYNDIKNSSQALYTLKQATMYKTLKKMEEDGLITSAPGEESNGAKRVYFSLTEFGRAQIVKTMKEWEFSRTILDALVSDKKFNADEQEAPFDTSKLRPKTKRSTKHTEDAIDDNDVDCDMNEDNVANNNIMAAANNSITDNNSAPQALPPIISATSTAYSQDDEYISIAKQTEIEQNKIKLDDIFSFSQVIDSKLVESATTSEPIAAKSTVDTDYSVQEEAYNKLFSKDYEPPKSDKTYTTDYKPYKSPIETKPAKEIRTDSSSYSFSSERNITDMKLQSNEDINNAALKLYDMTYNPTKSSEFAGYQAPIISSRESEKSNLTYFDTEVHAKDPLSTNEKRKVLDEFMKGNIDKNDGSKELTSPTFDDMQKNIMFATVESNRSAADRPKFNASITSADKYNSSETSNDYIPYAHNNKSLNVKKDSQILSDLLNSSDKTGYRFDIDDSVQVSNKAAVNADVVATNSESSTNYISSFDNIFRNHEQDNAAITAAPSRNNKDEEFEDVSFSKMKAKLAKDDIKLKEYLKNNTTKYYVGRYFYSNLLMRDWSYITYGIFFIFALAMYFISASVTKSASVVGLVIPILLGLSLPIAITLVWFYDRKKRKLTNFNPIQALIYCAILMITSLLVIILVGFLGVKINFSDIKTYFDPLVVPIISLCLIPISAGSYALLYNSKHYHLK